jgi:hypothetical protein
MTDGKDGGSVLDALCVRDDADGRECLRWYCPLSRVWGASGFDDLEDVVSQAAAAAVLVARLGHSSMWAVSSSAPWQSGQYGFGYIALKYALLAGPISERRRRYYGAS